VMGFGGRLRAIAPYLVVLALGALLFHVAASFTYARSGARLGPDVWPRAILVLLMVACGVRIVRLVLWPSLARTSTEDPAAAGAALADDVTPGHVADAGAADSRGVGAAPHAGTAGEPEVPLSPARLALGIALTVLYVLGLPTLGFAFATALYIAAMCRVGDYRRWPVILPTAIVGSLAFMFVFQRIVYVSLPLGTPPFDTIALTLMRLMGIR